MFKNVACSSVNDRSNSYLFRSSDVILLSIFPESTVTSVMVSRIIFVMRWWMLTPSYSSMNQTRRSLGRNWWFHLLVMGKGCFRTMCEGREGKQEVPQGVVSEYFSAYACILSNLIMQISSKLCESEVLRMVNITPPNFIQIVGVCERV